MIEVLTSSNIVKSVVDSTCQSAERPNVGWERDFGYFVDFGLLTLIAIYLYVFPPLWNAQLPRPEISVCHMIT
jgi:hypothetical protein